MRRVATWIQAHGTAFKWLSAALIVLLLVVPALVGAERATGPAPDFQAQQVAVRLPAARHSVVGEVRAVGTSELLIRGPKGALFAVRWGPAAQFRAFGRPVPASSLRPGDHVVVIGRPAADGSLIANRVTLTSSPRTDTPAPAP
jgi:hypothetical protein